MSKDRYSLDVDDPEKVSKVLREVAQNYYESAHDLQASWQEKDVGTPWFDIGKILEKAADQIDKKSQNWGF